jgi:hypothetical protein
MHTGFIGIDGNYSKIHINNNFHDKAMLSGKGDFTTLGEPCGIFSLLNINIAHYTSTVEACNNRSNK